MAERPGWTVVSRGTTGRMLLVLAAIALPSGLLLAGAMMPLGVYLSGRLWTIWEGYLAGVALLALLIGPIMVARASRFLAVDASGTQFRTRFRRHSVLSIRRAYRKPDSVADGRFQLRLAIPQSLDVVLSLSPSGGEVSTEALDALIELLENAPIEPDPRYRLRPPFAEELGPRSAAQQLHDEVGDRLLAFEEMTFSKAGLLAEVRGIREAQLGRGVAVAGDLAGDLALRAPGGPSRAGIRDSVIRDAESAGERKGSRGPFAVLGPRWRAGVAAVNAWLSASGQQPVPLRGPLWWAGLALTALMLVLPCVLCGMLSALVTGRPDPPQALSNAIAFLFLSWPLLLWNSAHLLWADRLRWFRHARDAALLARADGHEAPREVADFFGPPFPEMALRIGAVLLLCFNGIALLAGGIATIFLSHTAVGPVPVLALGAPIGTAAVVASAFMFVWFYRRFAGEPLLLVRATVLWRAIAD